MKRKNIFKRIICVFLTILMVIPELCFQSVCAANRKSKKMKKQILKQVLMKIPEIIPHHKILKTAMIILLKAATLLFRGGVFLEEATVIPAPATT